MITVIIKVSQKKKLPNVFFYTAIIQDVHFIPTWKDAIY